MTTDTGNGTCLSYVQHNHRVPSGGSEDEKGLRERTMRPFAKFDSPFDHKMVCISVAFLIPSQMMKTLVSSSLVGAGRKTKHIAACCVVSWLHI
jgi:hypothetical protein